MRKIIKTLLLLSVILSLSSTVYSQSYEEWSKNPDGIIKYNIVVKRQKLKCAKCYISCNYKFESFSDFDFSNSDNPEFLERYFNENSRVYFIALAAKANLGNKCEKVGCKESYSGNHIWEVLDEKITKDKMTFP